MGKRQHSKQYLDYLKSPEWAIKRIAVLKRDNHRCAKCGAQFRLHVHHKTYKRLGDEPLDDLITLCHVCHKAQHAPKAKVRVLVEIAKGVLVPKGQTPTTKQKKNAKKMNRQQTRKLKWNHKIRAKRKRRK